MKKELSYLETIKAIDEVKKYFERQLEARLSLTKVQSPLFVKTDSGLQDALTGVEKDFQVTSLDKKIPLGFTSYGEIVYTSFTKGEYEEELKSRKKLIRKK